MTLPFPADSGEYVLYCDGASRGNPGAASFGYVLFDSAGNEVAAHGAVLGTQTNNFAEYTALIEGLAQAASLGVRRICVRMDSELAVRQMLGIYRVKNEGLKPLFAAAQQQRSRFAAFRIEHVPRAQNARADSLANAALDALKSPSQ